jgi:hypothetical protein
VVYFVTEPEGIVESLQRLQRMARVLVSPLRIKIMAELSVRPMSPKMFQEEFGGGELSRIDECFKELAKYGWAEPIGTMAGGKRRGGTEHLYRARQLPIFDSSTWPRLPKAMREMVSWRILRTLAKRVQDAIAAGTMDARADRHFSWTPALADQLAWDRIVDRADGLFGFMVEELRRANSRLAESGEKPIPATVALAVFESPGDRFTPQPQLHRLTEARAPASSAYPFSMRMAKAMIDPLRILILAELSTRAMSAKQFYEEFGGGDVTKDRVYRAFRTLKRFGWIVLVETKAGGKRRGGKEKFYCAANPPILDHETWPALPTSMKEIVSGAIFETLSERFREAIEAGTMDARTDRHFTWTPLVLDQLGWDGIIARMDALFDFVGKELKKAEARLAKSGEEPIPMTVALAAFESPPATTRLH